MRPDRSPLVRASSGRTRLAFRVGAHSSALVGVLAARAGGRRPILAAGLLAGIAWGTVAVPFLAIVRAAVP